MTAPSSRYPGVACICTPRRGRWPRGDADIDGSEKLVEVLEAVADARVSGLPR